MAPYPRGFNPAQLIKILMEYNHESTAAKVAILILVTCLVVGFVLNYFLFGVVAAAVALVALKTGGSHIAS